MSEKIAARLVPGPDGVARLFRFRLRAESILDSGVHLPLKLEKHGDIKVFRL